MSRNLSLVAVLSLALAAPAMAQQKPAPKPAPPAKTAIKRETAEQKKLMAEAKVTESAARATALAAVAKGATVSSHELERENGKLIYTYDLKIPGKSGIDEIHVDAITGKIIGKPEHEPAKKVK